METPVLTTASLIRLIKDHCLRVVRPLTRITGETPEMIKGKLHLLAVLAEDSLADLEGEERRDMLAAIKSLDDACGTLGEELRSL